MARLVSCRWPPAGPAPVAASRAKPASRRPPAGGRARRRGAAGRRSGRARVRSAGVGAEHRRCAGFASSSLAAVAAARVRSAGQSGSSVHSASGSRRSRRSSLRQRRQLPALLGLVAADGVEALEVEGGQRIGLLPLEAGLGRAELGRGVEQGDLDPLGTLALPERDRHALDEPGLDLGLGPHSAIRRLVSSSSSEGASSSRTKCCRAARPYFSALRELRALPSAVAGPRERAPLRRAASIWAGERGRRAVAGMVGVQWMTEAWPGQAATCLIRCIVIASGDPATGNRAHKLKAGAH